MKDKESCMSSASCWYLSLYHWTHSPSGSIQLFKKSREPCLTWSLAGEVRDYWPTLLPWTVWVIPKQLLAFHYTVSVSCFALCKMLLMLTLRLDSVLQHVTPCTVLLAVFSDTYASSAAQQALHFSALFQAISFSAELPTEIKDKLCLNTDGWVWSYGLQVPQALPYCFTKLIIPTAVCLSITNTHILDFISILRCVSLYCAVQMIELGRAKSTQIL